MVGPAPEVRAQHLDGGVARALVGAAEQPTEPHLGGVEVEVRIERISKGGGRGGGGGGGLDDDDDDDVFPPPSTSSARPA